MFTRSIFTSARHGHSASLAPLMRAWRVSQRSGRVGAVVIRRAESIIREATANGERLLPLSQNALLSEFVASPQAGEIRKKYGSFPVGDRVRLRLPRSDTDPERQGDLIVLKRPAPETGEKGVILIKYSESIEVFAAVFDIEHLCANYCFVFEPSWWGYAELRFLYFIGQDARVLVQSPMREDRRFIAGLNANLVPIPLGAGDWVDPVAFEPQPGVVKRWDVVMVAAWSHIKRHTVLFRALQQLRGAGHRLRVALVGYPMELTVDDMRRLAQRYGVEDQCTFMDSVSHQRVAEIVAESKVSLLLSRQEGASKALYESIFADTAVLVPADHLGVNLDHITEEVGAYFSDTTLADQLLQMAQEAGLRSPRAWALANTGAPRSTELLDLYLARVSIENGDPWSRGIVPKKNAPGLRYLEPGRYREFEAEYSRLQEYLR